MSALLYAFTKTSAGKWIIRRIYNQTCFDRVVVDVPDCSVKVGFIPNKSIKIFALPKCSLTIEGLVDFLGRKRFPRMENFIERMTFNDLNKDMDMIWHHDPRQ